MPRTRVSGLAEVTSPPYDVIASENEDQLLASDPHNIVRIIRPRHPAGQPGSSYDDAAADLQQWLADGILVPDAEPALYVYEQVVAAPGRPARLDRLQRGLIGAVELVPPRGRDRPAARGRGAGPGGRAAGADGSHPGQPGAGIPALRRRERDAPAPPPDRDETALTRPPLAQARTADGMRHRLWAITDPAELAAIAADLAPRSALIADGHHRYAAYLELSSAVRRPGTAPGPGTSAWRCWSTRPRTRPSWARSTGSSPAWPPAGGRAGRERVRGARDRRAGPRTSRPRSTSWPPPGGTASRSWWPGDGRAWLLTDPDPAQLAAAMAGKSAEPWRQLPAAVLQDLLMDRVWQVRDDEATVSVEHDPVGAIRAADEAPGRHRRAGLARCRRPTCTRSPPRSG